CLYFCLLRCGYTPPLPSFPTRRSSDLWVRTPRYRIQRHNVIALLELVLQGRASENDWRVFAAIPLRHNPALEEVRERCMDIEEREYIGPGRNGFLFSQKGLGVLREILE